MMLRRWISTVALGGALLGANGAFAAAVKTYQVTGPVLEVTDSSVTVEKGKAQWEIARERFGFAYLEVSSTDAEAVAPIMARLNGR